MTSLCLKITVFYYYKSTSCSTIEGSFAECGQLIAAGHFGSFLTPDMASKTDASHGIQLS